ncbi:MAG: aspartate dehydrogenase [Clostridia bacterium]|nr:aspartate dehydrogenase [Clostridia bacterium]
MLFRKRKEAPKAGYDPEVRTPVIRCSICTGEQVAGFQRKDTGAFEEVMLIRGEEDLAAFRESWGITGEIRKIY